MEQETNNKSDEIWLDVTHLVSFNSDLTINKHFYFKRGVYQVSNLGRFKKNNKVKKVKPDLQGTFTYVLGGHRFKLHQIVLQTFSPSEVSDGMSPDHINRFNRTDNSLSNLRWATRKTQYKNRENSIYKCKKVKCLNNGKIYNSCQEAENELGLVHNNVARVARGERNSIHGYRFIFL